MVAMTTQTVDMVLVGVVTMPIVALAPMAIERVMVMVEPAMTLRDAVANTQVVFDDSSSDQNEDMLAVQADSGSTYMAEDTTFDGFEGEVG